MWQECNTASERALPSPVIRGTEYAVAAEELKCDEKLLLIIEENRAAVRDIQAFLMGRPDGVTEDELYRRLRLDRNDPANRRAVKRYMLLSRVLSGPAIDATYAGDDMQLTFTAAPE